MCRIPTGQTASFSGCDAIVPRFQVFVPRECQGRFGREGGIDSLSNSFQSSGDPKMTVSNLFQKTPAQAPLLFVSGFWLAVLGGVGSAPKEGVEAWSWSRSNSAPILGKYASNEPTCLQWFPSMHEQTNMDLQPFPIHRRMNVTKITSWLASTSSV